MNEIRAQRVLRELKCDPVTQMCERVLGNRGEGAAELGAAFRTLLFVTVLAAGLVANASEPTLTVRIADLDGDIAALDLEGETISTFTGARIQVVGHPAKFEVVRVGDREVRARLPVRLPSGAYVVRHGADSKPGAEWRSVKVNVGAVGPIVQDD